MYTDLNLIHCISPSGLKVEGVTHTEISSMLKAIQVTMSILGPFTSTHLSVGTFESLIITARYLHEDLPLGLRPDDDLLSENRAFGSISEGG